MLDDLRRAIQTVPGLTTRERRILRLHYVYGLSLADIVNRIGRCYVIVSTEHASGVSKLRQAVGDHDLVTA